jgi:twitching motility protein PilI
MSPEQPPSPFRLLQQLEAYGRAHAAALPAQAEARAQWVGVGFRLGRLRFLAPMAEVKEILTYPQLSQVPRTKPWLKGLANVRGTLLPIMDLNGFLGDRASPLTRLSRVLVVQYQSSVAGLLVDEILGLRQFFEEDWRPVSASIDPALAPYVSGEFEQENAYWHVFSVSALTGHPQFLKVAV